MMVAQLGLCLQLYNAWPGVLEAFLFDTYFKAMNSLKESQAMNLFVINTENHKQSSFNISSARLQSMNHFNVCTTVRVSECEYWPKQNTCNLPLIGQYRLK